MTALAVQRRTDGVMHAAPAVQRRTDGVTCAPLLLCRSGVSQRRCEPKREWKNVLRKSMESNRGAKDSPGGATLSSEASIEVECHGCVTAEVRAEKRVKERSSQVNGEQWRRGRQPSSGAEKD